MTMRPKIKICGITNVQDANWVSALGCEYVGLNFVAASPRKVSVAAAAKITSSLPPFVKSIGVFADASLNEITKTLRKAPLSGVQLHGEEFPEFCSQLKNNLNNTVIIKTFRVRENWDPAVIEQYAAACDFFLFDAFKEDSLGGTGEAFNWDALLGLSINKPFFLAGGLTPENVAQAVAKVHPYAVDVASGVESSPRRKNFEKMKVFVQVTRNVA